MLICASNPFKEAETRVFLFLMQASLTKYFVSKLSLPSTTISYFEIILSILRFVIFFYKYLILYLDLYY